MEKTAQQCARMMTIASKATASDGRAFLVSNHPQISYMVFRVRAYLALGMLNVYSNHLQEVRSATPLYPFFQGGPGHLWAIPSSAAFVQREEAKLHCP